MAALVCLSGTCLLIGFLTPIVAVMAVAVTIISTVSALPLSLQTLAGIFVLAAAIALLGPGAFSIDARLFGRREILIRHVSQKEGPESSLNHL